MIRHGRVAIACAAAVLAALGAACAPKPRPKAADDDAVNAKVFADLDKNDKDEKAGDAGPGPSRTEDEKPKGPVYPAPFTAEQIHAATRNGRTYRYKVEVPGKAVKEYAITFRNVDDGGAEVHAGSSDPRRMAWLTLQQQSEFPKDRTTTHDEKLKTPAGKFECVVYEVAGEDGEAWSYYFGKKLPGAPVYFYVERNGKRLRTTTLVEHIPGR